MNGPTNKPLAPCASLGFSRRPLAAVARISLLAVVVAILGACGVQEGSGDSASPPAAPGTQEQAAADTAGDRGEKEPSASATNDGELGPPVLGDEDAPVTMVEYADYQ